MEERQRGVTEKGREKSLERDGGREMDLEWEREGGHKKDI